MSGDGECNEGREEEKERKRKRKKDMYFFFNDTATTEIYTLSLHDALPISSTMGGSIFTTRTQIKNI